MIGKLVVDYEEVSLGDLLEFLIDKGVECCVDGDNIYTYSSGVDVGAPNLIIVNKKKIQNYFFKELTSPPTRTPTNYVQTWLLEKFNEQERLRFEEQYQAELKKAQENIQKAMEEYKQLYTKYVNQQNKEAQSDGGSNN
nr:MAG TPA: oxidase [Caudoviricetes sp.]